MANVKITELTQYTNPVSTDVLPIVDVSSDVTKKISIADVMKNASAGTAAAPGIAFDGDNTGIYSPGADQLAIATNGTQRLLIDGSGNITQAGSLTAARFIPTGSTVPANGIYLPVANTVAIATNGTQRISIAADGGINIDNGGVFYDASTNRLAIGTTNPLGTLHVRSAAAGGTDPTIAANSIFEGAGAVSVMLNGNDTSTQSIYFRDASTAGNSFRGAIRYTHSDDALALFSAGAERARISSGRLLVGVAFDTGGALLQVNGDRIRVATAKTPASATATGTAGEICWDASYIYVAVANNTWKRAALSTW